MATLSRYTALLLSILISAPLNAASVRAGGKASGSAPVAVVSSNSDLLASAGSDDLGDLADVLKSKSALDSMFDGAAGERSSAAQVYASAPSEHEPKAVPVSEPKKWALAADVAMASAVASQDKEPSGSRGIMDRVSDIVNRLLGRHKQTPPDSAAVLKSRHWITVKADSREKRTRLLELGMSIEAHGDDFVEGIADTRTLEAIKKEFEVLKQKSLADFKPLDFPAKDAAYHNYAEMTSAMDALAAAHPNLVSKFSIGKSLEGKDVWAFRLNTTEKGTAASKKPGIVFMGAHHAREHLSVEVPLRLAKQLAESTDTKVKELLATRDVYIIPMVNPDGAEFDIKSGNYQMWRKNTRDNGDGSHGVDLNRNYSHKWGTGGSSKNPSSETFMGPKPFSEPETQNIKRFVDERPNLKVLLSYHTFSELILYPWGHKYDPIENKEALAIHETMARQMAQWTGYTPQQSSDLYIASGDTTDWSYGEKGLISFTFELTPKSMWEGGFYPGAAAIDSTVAKNLKPMLYLIEYADNPARVLKSGAGSSK